MDIATETMSAQLFFSTVSFSGIVFMSNVQPCVRLIFILCLFVLIWKKYKKRSEA